METVNGSALGASLLLLASFAHGLEGPPAAKKIKKDISKTRYEYVEKKITARFLDSTRSKDLEAAVKELMNELSVLEGDFQKAELSYKHSAETDSYFDIKLTSNQKHVFQDLTVVVDDVVLYESKPGTTITLDMIPLFQGPLPPGKHDFTFSAKAASASHGELAKGSVYPVTHKETVDVPPGKVRREIVLSIEDAQSNRIIARSREF